jgi:DNA modification methylase
VKLENIIKLGDCQDLLRTLPAESIDLIFTSPPYFNARPEYSEYSSYREYLEFMRNVVQNLYRVLAEGRFLVINTSPVLVSRSHRSTSSQRKAVPFDIHAILSEEQFEFIDDIVWVKPEGAGWATNRGRRFAADRQPLQYKTVPITEYVLVYRKSTDKLIDWNIKKHDPTIVNQSKIHGDYEHTNVWKINPETHSRHPAAFPLALAEKVISYYSFINDTVLDPFAGSGTTGKAAAKLGRKYVLFDNQSEYVDMMLKSEKQWHVKDMFDAKSNI